MTVVDASVITSLFNVADVNHQLARTWYERARSTSESLQAPAVLLSEVAAAFGRSINNPMGGLSLTNEIIDHKLIGILPVTVAMARLAAEIAATASIKGCDAIYVALAAQLNQVLVTFDDEQLERGSRVARVERPA
jgi:predicted nucleic acid-binding protein